MLKIEVFRGETNPMEVLESLLKGRCLWSAFTIKTTLFLIHVFHQIYSTSQNRMYSSNIYFNQLLLLSAIQERNLKNWCKWQCFATQGDRHHCSLHVRDHKHLQYLQTMCHLHEVGEDGKPSPYQWPHERMLKVFITAQERTGCWSLQEELLAYLCQVFFLFLLKNPTNTFSFLGQNDGKRSNCCSTSIRARKVSFPIRFCLQREPKLQALF